MVASWYCWYSEIRTFIFIVVDGSLLVLLVLGDQVVHVAFRLGKLHLIHTLACVPVEEGLATEHRSELLGDSLEQLLDRSRVAYEGGRHLETSGRDIAHRSLDIVRNPFHKVGAILVLNPQHL